MNYYVTVYVTVVLLSFVIGYITYTKKNMFISGQRVFFHIPVSIAIIATFDLIMWVIDGKNFAGAKEINVLFTYFYYTLQCVPVLMWTLFVGKRYLDENQYSRVRMIITAPMILIVIVCFVSLFNGCIFYFDENNFYHKGDMVYLVGIAIGVYLVIATLIIIAMRRRIRRGEIYCYLFFPLIPTICAIIQLNFYGLDIFVLGMVFSALTVLLSIMKESMMIDYLTKLNNRRQLQEHLEFSIAVRQQHIKNKYIVGVMLDLIKFKDINDTYGHAIGDVALEDASYIIRKSFSKNDFLSRYAGDEFVIIVLTDDENDYSKISENIKKNEKEFNDNSNRVYKLNFSIGCVIFDLDEKFVPSAFLEKIDKAMYDDKRNRKVGN